MAALYSVRLDATNCAHLVYFHLSSAAFRPICECIHGRTELMIAVDAGVKNSMSILFGSFHELFSVAQLINKVRLEQHKIIIVRCGNPLLAEDSFFLSKPMTLTPTIFRTNILIISCRTNSIRSFEISFV